MMSYDKRQAQYRHCVWREGGAMGSKCFKVGDAVADL